MKCILLVILGFIAISGVSTSAFAAKMNCAKFSKDVDSFKSELLKKQKQLSSMNSQLQSGTKAIDDYNKSCRRTSSPNCNPVMYNMVSGQVNMLTGQRQKLQHEIMNVETKQADAVKNFKLCKSVKLEKSAP